MELLIRFLIGGTAVSLFAMIADAIRPKSFAGIFAAAPSIALATLVLTAHRDGLSYAATEARSMIIGATAFLIYTYVSSRVMWSSGRSPAQVTLSGLGLWLAAALVGWLLITRVAS
jgi:uncharacterized membrane protein (GlpM family)